MTWRRRRLMPYGLSIFEVQDWAKWKAAFEGNAAMRKAVGQGAYQIFHTDDNPNKIVLLIEWESLEKARAFEQSKGLQEKHEESGAGPMEAYYLEQIGKGTT